MEVRNILVKKPFHFGIRKSKIRIYHASLENAPWTETYTDPQLKGDRSAKPGLPCTALSHQTLSTRYYLNPETL